MNGEPLDEYDLKALRLTARVQKEPTLAVGTEVLEQMIDEIVELRQHRDLMRTVLGGVESCDRCVVCSDRAADTLRITAPKEGT